MEGDNDIYPMYTENWNIGGYEPFVAKAIGETTGHAVLVINVAIGGTTIQQHLPGGTAQEYEAKVLADAMSKIPEKYTIHKLCWCWCQGEGNSTTSVATYVEDFGTLNEYYAEQGYEKCYIILTRASNSGLAWEAEQTCSMTYKNTTLASMAADSFSIDDGTMLGDDLHYSQYGRNIIGGQLSESIVEGEHLTKSSIDSTSLSLLWVIVPLILVGIVAFAARIYTERE